MVRCAEYVANEREGSNGAEDDGGRVGFGWYLLYPDTGTGSDYPNRTYVGPFGHPYLNRLRYA